MATAKISNFKIGILLSTVSSLFARLVAVISNLAVVKYVAPDTLGTFFGLQALVFMGSGLCSLGLPNAYRQIVSREIENRRDLLGSAVFIQSVALVFYLLALCIYVFYSKIGLSIGVVCIMAGASLVYWPDILTADLYVQAEYKKASLINVMTFLGPLVTLLFVFTWPNQLAKIGIGYLLGMLIWIFIAIKQVDFTSIKAFNFGRAKELLRVGAPFLASLSVTRVGLYFGLTYVVSSKGSFEAGMLGLTLKIYQVLLMLSATTTSVTVPYFHVLSHNQDYERLKDVLKKLVGPLWVVGGCLSSFAIIAPSNLVLLISTDKYLPAASLFPIVAISFMFKSLSIPAGDLLEGRKLQRFRLCVQIISTLIIVSASIYLFPIYGAKGCVIAMLSADLISFVLLWSINGSGLFKYMPWSTNIKAILIFAILVVSVMQINVIAYIKFFIFILVYLITTVAAGLWSPLNLMTFKWKSGNVV